MEEHEKEFNDYNEEKEDEDIGRETESDEYESPPRKGSLNRLNTFEHSSHKSSNSPSSNYPSNFNPAPHSNVNPRDFDDDDYQYLYFIEMINKDQLFKDYKSTIVNSIYHDKIFLNDDDLSPIIHNIIKVIDKLKKLDEGFTSGKHPYSLKPECNIPSGIKDIYQRINKNTDFSNIRNRIINFLKRSLDLEKPYYYVFLDKDNFEDAVNFISSLSNSRNLYPENLFAELLILRALADIFGVNAIPKWMDLYNECRKTIDDLRVKLSDRRWFQYFCDFRKYKKVSEIIDTLNKLSDELENDNINFAYLFDPKLCHGVKTTKPDFTDLKAFLLYKRLSVCDRYPECREIYEKFYSSIDELIHRLGLLQSSRFYVKIEPMITYSMVPYAIENKTYLLIALDTLNDVPNTKEFIDKYILENFESLRFGKKYNIAIILLPPGIFGLKSEKTTNSIRLITTDERLERDPVIIKLLDELRNKFKDFDVYPTINSYNYIINYNGKDVSLKDLQKGARLAQTRQLTIPSVTTSQEVPPPSGDIELDDNFLAGLRSLSSTLLLVEEGSMVIVYDQNKHGIEMSLARIASEAAKIRGYTVDPKYIPTIDEYEVSSIANTGVYVFKEELCNASSEVKEMIKRSLISMMGYKYSMIIIPKCLYDEFQVVIGGKPKAIIFENFSKEEISKLAYLASGLQLRYNGYDALSDVNVPFDKLLEKARSWLRMKYINKDIPSEGRESEVHRNLKAYMVKHLIEKEKINPEEIYVEYYIGDLKPDIFAKDMVIDAKSSIGRLPSDELLDVFQYSKISKKIRVIMRSIAVLLDIEGIIGRIRDAATQGIDLDVLIPSVNEKGEEDLISLRQLIEEAKYY